MIKDIFTIVRKDLKEMLTSRGNVKSGAMYLLIVIGVMGIFMPLQSGREWLTKPLIPLVWSWFPILLVISVVTDSFAGERERNTLETLLASRLSDKAILFGKITASVLYGWGIGLISNLVAVITVNITDPGTGFQFYDPMVLLLIVLIPLLLGILMSSIGVLVSLNAPTARAAYQRLSLVMLAVVFLPTILVNFGGEKLKLFFSETLRNANLQQIGIIAGLIMLLINGIIIWIAVQRFQRAKLILE